MDIEMLERLGVTDADARQIIETAKVPNTGNGPTHFIPAYDLMYYVNDVNRENTEVLTLGSRYNSDTSFVYGQQRLYADHEGESETYLYDGRGSVVQLLKDGAVTQEYAYDAYGYINADEFGIQAPFYGYNGEEQNPFTGLQYLRARYYAPQNGGFITQDGFSGVLTNALSQNRYAYAHNNPVNYADPSGHSIWDSIKNGVTNAVNSVKNFVSNVANKVSSAVSSAVNTVKSAVTGTTTKTVANTSSAVKKSYTNTAVRQKIGSYAGGAAAAAAGSVSTSYSNSVVNGVVADSRIPFTNAAGQTLLLPQHFSDVQASAQEFTRQGCAEGLEHVGSQQGWSSSNVVMLSTGAAVFGNSSLGQLISYALEHGLSLGGAAALAALDGPLPLADILASILALQTIASDWEQRIQERLAEYEKKESAEKSPVADQSTPANPPPDDEDPDDDWDEWDDYDEGPTNERVGKQKNHAPRDNQKQNEQVDRIVKDLGLSKAERRLLHDEITGQGYGYQEILEIAKEILGRR
ncbi:RHS repeat-associated core domain-containing protein [Ruthenibacterium lactatiformans]|uniref:RHS repeat-associated core domain-containing protein n=1 Tax=Ruthenibacterium lactatiformans TaxID=1550024 RepID=UPI00351FCB53